MPLNRFESALFKTNEDITPQIGGISRHSKCPNVTPFKIDQNKNQTRSIDKVQRPSPRFRSEEYSVYEKSEEMSYPNLWRFVGRRHAGAHLDGRQHGGRKPTKTSVTEFWYKSMNLSLEELINIKVTLFLINELLR